MGEASSQPAMINILDWLVGIEERAAGFYEQAAAVFAEDKTFSAFLLHLAAEESEHLELLSGAIDHSAQEIIAGACLSLDDNIRQSVEVPFDRGHELMCKGELTKQAIAGVIVEAEYCEWNEIFLYVIDTLKGQGREFQKAVAEIEQHRKEIETFISSFTWGAQILTRLGRLRQVWRRRILVVEDDPVIANLLKCLLMDESEVVLAQDGVTGLDFIRDGHFNVVVSDVEMPNLDGIALYKQALEIDPDLKKRFVFFSGTRKPEHHEFFRSENVVLLPKPSPMGRLRKVIYEVADAED